MPLSNFNSAAVAPDLVVRCAERDSGINCYTRASVVFDNVVPEDGCAPADMHRPAPGWRERLLC